jgi:hypothetical protein
LFLGFHQTSKVARRADISLETRNQFLESMITGQLYSLTDVVTFHAST